MRKRERERERERGRERERERESIINFRNGALIRVFLSVAFFHVARTLCQKHRERV